MSKLFFIQEMWIVIYTKKISYTKYITPLPILLQKSGLFMEL